MAAQVPDSIRLDGVEWSLLGAPLDALLARLPVAPRLVAPNEGIRRGYVAGWTVFEGRLWLDRVTATIEQPGQAPVTVPGEMLLATRLPLFADFFTGTLRVGRGRMLRYADIGFDSRWEQERLLEVVDGRLTTTHDLATLGTPADDPGQRDVLTRGWQDDPDRLPTVFSFAALKLAARTSVLDPISGPPGSLFVARGDRSEQSLDDLVEALRYTVDHYASAWRVPPGAEVVVTVMTQTASLGDIHGLLLRNLSMVPSADGHPPPNSVESAARHAWDCTARHAVEEALDWLDIAARLQPTGGTRQSAAAVIDTAAHLLAVLRMILGRLQAAV